MKPLKNFRRWLNSLSGSNVKSMVIVKSHKSSYTHKHNRQESASNSIIIGDCSRQIELEFDPCIFTYVDEKTKQLSKKVIEQKYEASLKKLRVLKEGIAVLEQNIINDRDNLLEWKPKNKIKKKNKKNEDPVLISTRTF